MWRLSLALSRKAVTPSPNGQLKRYIGGSSLCDRRHDVGVAKISADEQQRFTSGLGERIKRANDPCAEN